MKVGVCYFPTHYGANPVEIGRAVEAADLESIWVPEHTHIPASRQTPYPRGGELPREYVSTYDPFVTLGAIAAATSRIRLGTSICLVIEHDPIVLAKEISTLDRISDGRFLFGIGGGWNREEMANHGTDPARRWSVLRERILAMKEIWTRDAAEFHGEFVNFDPIWQWPKPVQQPHPPILIGGDFPRSMARVVEYGDGWLPHPGRSATSIGRRLKQLNDLADAAGRGPIPVSVFGLGLDLDPAELVAYQGYGVERCIFMLPPEPAGAAFAAIDRIAKAAASADIG